MTARTAVLMFSAQLLLCGDKCGSASPSIVSSGAPLDVTATGTGCWPGSIPGHEISSARVANVTPLDAPRWDQTCDLEVKVDQNIRYMKNKVLFRDPVFLLLSRLHSELCLNR